MTFAVYKLYIYYIKTVYDHNSYFSDFVIWFEGLTPPLPGQSTLSIMQCAGYSHKTTTALPPQWTWSNMDQPPVYDIESHRYYETHKHDNMRNLNNIPIYARQNTTPRGSSTAAQHQPITYNTSTNNAYTSNAGRMTQLLPDQHSTQQRFVGAIPLNQSNPPDTTNSTPFNLTQQPINASAPHHEQNMSHTDTNGEHIVNLDIA